LNAHEIIASVVGDVKWISATEGFCECPGKELHSHGDGRKDCKLYLNGVPTLFCFHASCAEMLSETNKRLRKEIGEQCPNCLPQLAPAQLKAAKEEAARKENLRKRAANGSATILKKYAWPYERICGGSPIALTDNPKEHWRLLLECFDDEDVVWIGNKFDSGLAHGLNFKPVTDWLENGFAPAQFICPSTFKPGSTSRSNDSVAKKKFLVVESDELNHDEVGAVFKWMEAAVQMTLRAIVDTAGKSLHAWFEYPPDTVIEHLKLVLPELRCDPKLFTPSQPVRLPGAERDGKLQKLIYLKQEVVCAQ
jgi:hypothetical protein